MDRDMVNVIFNRYHCRLANSMTVVDALTIYSTKQLINVNPWVDMLFVGFDFLLSMEKNVFKLEELI